MTTELRDRVDRKLERWGDDLPAGVDREVEGIVARIFALAGGLKRSLEQTLADFELTQGEWSVLLHLRSVGEPYRLSPGVLAKDDNLSSGAMTNRLDRLEEAGLVRRLPNPDDRRALLVELTPEGHEVWERSVEAQAAKESLVASALDDEEKRRLNDLLRRLMLAAEDR